MNSRGGLKGDLDGPIMSSFGVPESNCKNERKSECRSVGKNGWGGLMIKKGRAQLNYQRYQHEGIRQGGVEFRKYGHDGPSPYFRKFQPRDVDLTGHYGWLSEDYFADALEHRPICAPPLRK